MDCHGSKAGAGAGAEGDDLMPAHRSRPQGTPRRPATAQSATPKAIMRGRKPMTPEEREDHINPRLPPRAILGCSIPRGAASFVEGVVGWAILGAFLWSMLAYVGIA